MVLPTDWISEFRLLAARHRKREFGPRRQSAPSNFESDKDENFKCCKSKLAPIVFSSKGEANSAAPYKYHDVRQMDMM
jgi:hypothetical protein